MTAKFCFLICPKYRELGEVFNIHAFVHNSHDFNLVRCSLAIEKYVPVNRVFSVAGANEIASKADRWGVGK